MALQKNNLLKYEMSFKKVSPNSHLTQISDQMVKEVKSVAGWETEVEIHVEPEVKDKGLYLVSVTLHGRGEKLVVKKRGKMLLSLFKKVRRAVLRQVHKRSRRSLRMRRKTKRLGSFFRRYAEE